MTLGTLVSAFTNKLWLTHLLVDELGSALKAILDEQRTQTRLLSKILSELEVPPSDPFLEALADIASQLESLAGPRRSPEFIAAINKVLSALEALGNVVQTQKE